MTITEIKKYTEMDIIRVMIGVVTDYKISLDNILNCKVRTNDMKYRDIKRYEDVYSHSLIIVRTIDWGNPEISKHYEMQKEIIINMSEHAVKEIYK